jgi:hypothetical protein
LDIIQPPECFCTKLRATAVTRLALYAIQKGAFDVEAESLHSSTTFSAILRLGATIVKCNVHIGTAAYLLTSYQCDAAIFSLITFDKMRLPILKKVSLVSLTSNRASLLGKFSTIDQSREKFPETLAVDPLGNTKGASGGGNCHGTLFSDPRHVAAGISLEVCTSVTCDGKDCCES